MSRPWISVALYLFTGAVNADELTGREALNATLWMQVAPEYRANVQQVYRMAAERIAAPAPGSAAIEQAGIAPAALARLPTAVILDLDETVLDNSVFQARLLRDRAVYNPQNWGEWVMAAEV
jgi:predicted secreted acid phosphatase